MPGGLGILKLVRFLCGNILKKLVYGQATYLNNFVIHIWLHNIEDIHFFKNVSFTRTVEW